MQREMGIKWSSEMKGQAKEEKVGGNGNERRILMYAEKVEVKRKQNCKRDG